MPADQSPELDFDLVDQDERFGEPVEDRPDVGDGEDAQWLPGGADDHVLHVEPVDVTVDVGLGSDVPRPFAGVANG